MRTQLSRRSVFLAASVTCGLTPAVAEQVKCDMSLAFNQVDADAPGHATPVWADAEGNLMFIAPLNVNTDGTRRSYSVSDFWGETVALNNLCNAMRDRCKGLTRDDKEKRRIATQAAAAAGWPKDQLDATRLSPKIIPMPGGKPCAEVDGFLVSATALHKRDIKDWCDLSNYVDAINVPALVVPGAEEGRRSEFSKRDVAVGDLVIAISLKFRNVVPAVVGDVGPFNKLGEGSIAMNSKLIGTSGIPANYHEVKELQASRSFVLIFRNTRDKRNPYLSADRIDPDAYRHFAAWGGEARANACASEYTSAGRR